MTALQLIQLVTWAVYICIFLVVGFQAVRQPTRSNIDIALFFSASAVIIAISTATMLRLLPTGPLLTDIAVALLLALPYFLLRLVDDFSVVPVWLKHGAEITLVLLVAAASIILPPYPTWLNVLLLLYLIVLLAYCATAFVRAAQIARGVTTRRLGAIAAGTFLLVLMFLMAGLRLGIPALAEIVPILSGIASLASGLSYYLGFAPPGWLRRAWQEPELRAFLGRAARLPRLPDIQAILRELEQGAANSLGARNARIGLWDTADAVLRFTMEDGSPFDLDTNIATPAGQAFTTKRPIFVPRVRYESQALQEMSQTYGAAAVLAAPIIADEKSLGVLTVSAPQASIFADDDLNLVQLLADQAAVILESRALIDEAAQVRAREEVTRLKDDFLSAAAHDLKTPLTTLIAQAQMLERRALRYPDAPSDLKAIQRLIKEGQRLRDLVLELLDALRAEQGNLIGQREETDITEVVREICVRHTTKEHACSVESNGSLVGMYDRNRVSQLIENLVENAIKYSPDGGKVRVRVQQQNGQAHLTVTDIGIGIPAEDISHIFDRFYRARNVDDKRFAGLGLGLFICRGIVEQHGGQIWASRNDGQGTTVHVTLPLGPEEGDHVR
jgi:signal transduction histidine kinase